MNKSANKEKVLIEKEFLIKGERLVESLLLGQDLLFLDKFFGSHFLRLFALLCFLDGLALAFRHEHLAHFLLLFLHVPLDFVRLGKTVGSRVFDLLCFLHLFR